MLQQACTFFALFFDFSTAKGARLVYVPGSEIDERGGEEWETKGFLVEQGGYALVGRITVDRMT